jgi:polysaccharide pyruvyl transferase WcaK-like protein
LGASFGTGNLGVSALASGTIAAAFNGLRDARILFVDYGKEPAKWTERISGKTVEIPLVNVRFSNKPWQPNHILRLLATVALMRSFAPPSLKDRWISKSPWLRQLFAVQTYFSIAGGDSFSDLYGLQRLLYVSLPQILALWIGRPLVLLPQTYGPFKTRLSRWIAHYILKRAKLVYSRDQEGLKVAADLLGGPDLRVRFAYDMGFVLEPLPPAQPICERLRQIKEQGPLAGLNVSGLLYMGGYTRSNMFGLKSDYAEVVRSILNFLVAEAGCRVLLVPHVLGAENEESDVPACKRILADFAGKHEGRLHFIEGNFDHHEIKYLIGQCDFFVGSRMHACIAALSQCVPAVGLAYSRKFAGVLDSVSGGSRVIDLREAGRKEALETVNEAFRQRDQLRRELQEKMPGIKQSVLNLFGTNDFKSLLTPE